MVQDAASACGSVKFVLIRHQRQYIGLISFSKINWWILSMASATFTQLIIFSWIIPQGFPRKGEDALGRRAEPAVPRGPLAQPPRRAQRLPGRPVRLYLHQLPAEEGVGLDHLRRRPQTGEEAQERRARLTS